MWRYLLSAVALFLVATTPARAEWRRAESPHFIVYSEGQEAKLREQLALLEDFHGLLLSLTGAREPETVTKIELYMIRGYGQMRQIRPVGSGVGGFYTADPGGIIAVADQGQREDYMTNNEILLHEYAHHFMLQNFPATYPRWYVEGFAEYLATARLDDDVIEWGRFNPARASWLADRSGWLPLDRLLFGDPRRLEGYEGAKYYAQSWILVHYLFREPDRRRRLAAYLGAVTRGAAPRQAFAEAFDTTPSALQRELSSYGRDGMTYSRATRASARRPVAVSISVMPPSADDLLLARAAMSRGYYGRADGLLARVRRAAARHDEPFARRVQAMVEAYYGDGADADRILDSMLRDTPTDAELLYLKGIRFLRAGFYDEANRAAHYRRAQPFFVRAHRADPRHYPTLYRYAESLSLEPAFLTENTGNILMLANQIAPQAPEITLSVANHLLRRGEFEQAEALLAPLAANAHRGRLIQTAILLHGKASARDNRDLPPVFITPGMEDEN